MSYGIINIIKNTGYYFFIEINKYFKIMQNKEDLNKLSFRDKLKDFSFAILISLYLTLLIPPIGIFFVIVLPIFTLFQMKKIRKIYMENISLYQSYFSEYIPECMVSNPKGGFFLWVKAPERTDSRQLALYAVKNGFTIAPGVIFSGRSNYVNYFRLNAACGFSDKTMNALDKIGKFVRK